jgi:SAM-dependent methyltransferase
MPDPPPGFFEGTEMPDGSWWQTLWADPASVLTCSGLTEGVSAIDLCAGDGWFTLPMAHIARHVLAIDIDAALLSVAKQRIGEAGLNNCEFVVANAYDLNVLVTRQVDYVLIANAFHGVPDQTRLAKVVAASLAPKGRFAIVNWHRTPREQTTVLGEPRGPRTELRMTPDAVVAAVRPSGLALLQVEPIPPYHYAAIFEKVSS